MLYSLLYIFVSVFAVIVVQYVTVFSNISPAIALACTNLFAIIIFNILNIKRAFVVYAQLKEKSYVRSVILVNIYISVLWFGYYYAVQMCGSSRFILLCYLSVSIPAGLLANQLKKTIPVIIIIMIYFMECVHSSQVMFGSLISLVAGIATFYYFRESEILHKKHHSTSLDVLSLRFYLVFILSAILSFKSGIQQLNLSVFGGMFFLSLLTIVIPLYLAQIGITKIGAKKHSFLITFLPVLTYIGENLAYHDLSWQLFILSILPPIILNVSYFKLLKQIIFKRLSIRVK